VKLGIYLEELFDLEIPEDVLKGFVTLANIVQYLSRRFFRDGEFPAPALAA
jgi:acyl carrier protein